jgi:hypothetical protein
MAGSTYGRPYVSQFYKIYMFTYSVVLEYKSVNTKSLTTKILILHHSQFKDLGVPTHILV